MRNADLIQSRSLLTIPSPPAHARWFLHLHSKRRIPSLDQASFVAATTLLAAIALHRRAPGSLCKTCHPVWKTKLQNASLRDLQRHVGADTIRPFHLRHPLQPRYAAARMRLSPLHHSIGPMPQNYPVDTTLQTPGLCCPAS